MGCSYLVILGKAHPARRIEMLPHLTVEAVLGQELAVLAEQLQPVVPRVGHQDLVLAVAGNVPRIQKLPIAVSFLSKLQYELTWE